MERKILEYVKNNRMLEKGDGVVVGVSGGADSMALLLFLISIKDEYELRLKVVHINHGIRGEAADADARFVESFCLLNHIDFVCVTGDIPTLAKESKCTEEEAGRNYRYATFERICKEEGYNKLAIAHNRDDNAETVLFNMFRGSGLSGIRGIAPVKERNGITIIRPLMVVSRDEIEKYLERKNMTYCIDATNLETEYSRNRIRLRVLPYVRQQINEGASKHIAEFAAQASELEQFLDEMTTSHIEELEAANELTYIEIEGAVEEISIDIRRLVTMNKTLRRSIIRRLVSLIAGSLKDIESKHIEAIDKLLEMGTGKRIELPYRIIARRDYGRLIISIKKDIIGESINIDCNAPGEYNLGNGMIARLSIVTKNGDYSLPKNDYTKCFDYDKIKAKICFRNRNVGDYLIIGTGKKKSLKSFFIDSKINREKRARIPLFTEGDHVLWVIGYRRDDSCLITEETERVLVVEIEGAKGVH